MDRYEVIIVGGGPAGSTAGSILASAGYRVCILEEKFFPRDKICGDALSAGAIEILRQVGHVGERILDEANHRVYTNRLVFPNGQSIDRKLKDSRKDLDFHVILPRILLDAWLAENFRSCGGVLIEGFQVQKVLEVDGRATGVEGIKDGKTGSMSSKIVIAADGESSVSRAFFRRKVNPPQHRAIAMRAYFDQVNTEDGVAEHYFGLDIPLGYGWIFPLGKGKANVGVILRCDAQKKYDKELSDVFHRFAHENPVTRSRMGSGTIHGTARKWSLSLGTRAGGNYGSGIMVAGDAGSFVDPFSGEGIYHAVLTGKLAAETAMRALARNDVSASSLEEYERTWRAILRSVYRKKSLVSNVIHRTNRLHMYRFRPWVSLLRAGWK